ncbi:50S ribosomal protein L2 [Candidatus Marinamargulisbacteria bacterium SCGC AG-410-N11]|nr:50S ribosomal protein L2 [Candidatus Marinamargulisbacteria bacterium SCGC AG-410-N11]
MALKQYKPRTPGLRQRKIVNKKGLSKQKRNKSLTVMLRTNSGRNNQGKITVRSRSGGGKRFYRQIDFKRNKNVEGVIKTIEYDPNRGSFISLVYYSDGDKRYIISPQDIKIGDVINTGELVDIKPGNTKQLKDIPVGTNIHNIELKVGKGAQLVRAAGASAVLMGKHETRVIVKLPSGETRYINHNCNATIGVVSNSLKRNEVIGKAGANRWKGWRPKVRGAVMNRCDHPHGGGEGRAPVGLSGPKTPWGKPTLGYKTRSVKKSNKNIVTKRKK